MNLNLIKRKCEELDIPFGYGITVAYHGTQKIVQTPYYNIVRKLEDALGIEFRFNRDFDGEYYYIEVD